MRIRFFVVLLMLAATAMTLHLRGDSDRTPAALPLSSLPKSIGPWMSVDVGMDPGVLHILGDGRFLNRLYFEHAKTPVPAGSPGPVSLFIGYFPTQRTGQSIHSPQNCLPGAGWTFESARPIVLTDVRGKTYDVGEYVITDGTIRQEVLYWYRAHGRSISSDFRAKLFLIADAIRYSRTDGALIRVITPVQTGETTKQAHDRAIAFAAQTAPLLPFYIPD